MKQRMCVVLLLAVTALVYTNALGNNFTYDDARYVLGNHAVRAFSVQELFRPTSNNVFRPLTFLTYALNWAAGGADPVGYHVTNLLLHAAVVLLLYLLLRTLLESFPCADSVAFAAAIVFAVHPIHTEAVASIAGRSELLAAGLLLAAWLLHLRDLGVPAALCFLAALLSKESAIVFVPLVLAGDYARGKWKPIWRYVSMAVVASLYLVLFWRVEGGRFGEKSVSFIDNPLASLPAHLRLLNAVRIAWKYVGLHFYPAALSYDYSYNAIPLYANWRHFVLPAIAAAAVVIVWIWAAWTKRKTWMLAGAIYLGGFAVTANILMPTGTIMGERLAYLPSAGFCLLLALVWGELVERRPVIGWALLGILVVALSARAIVRNRDWRDNFTLFYSGVQAAAGSARGHMNLADEYMNQGNLEAARTEFQAALRIYPRFADAMENYGLLESRMGLNKEAGETLDAALSLVEKGSVDYDFMEVNLANQLMKLGRNDEALGHLNHAIGEWPGYAPAWSNRAAVHYGRGEAALARADAEKALQLDPANGQAVTVLHLLDTPQTAKPRQGGSQVPQTQATDKSANDIK